MKVRVTIEMEVSEREMWPERQRDLSLERKVLSDYDWESYVEENHWKVKVEPTAIWRY